MYDGYLSSGTVAGSEAAADAKALPVKEARCCRLDNSEWTKEDSRLLSTAAGLPSVGLSRVVADLSRV